MRTIFSFIFCILISSVAVADNLVTASITVTNATTNGMTFTVNGNIRTFSSTPINPATQIITNTDITGCGGKTNLLTQIGLNQFSGITASDTSSNQFQLKDSCGGTLVVVASAGWAKVTYSTQTCSTVTSVGVPFDSYYNDPNDRTNTGTQLAQDIDTYDTNSVFVDLTKTQTIPGQKTFSNTNNQIFGLITSLAISGNSVRLTNGVYYTPALSGPVMTNGVNYGNAFSSPGAGSLSEQFGDGSVANAFKSTTVGGNSTTNFASSFGHEAIASGWGSTAVGANSVASATNAFAGGAFATASGINSSAIGGLAQATFNNSVAIGPSSATTAMNQVMLGAAGISTVVQNNLAVQTNFTVGKDTVFSGNFSPQGLTTNLTTIGTNNFPANSDIAFTPLALSSLANGNNADIPVGTNVIIEVSGPSADFAITGIAAANALRGGKTIIIVNLTGFNMTISHQSGVEPTAANRIISLTGSDLVTTGNGSAQLYYSSSASRWIVEEFTP